MRREGRQHGMVRTYHVLPSPLNPISTSRILNKIDSPTTAGLFIKVSKKPTNHSKFTGKCEKVKCLDCHLHPSCKSKDKSKGTQKLKSSNDALNYQQLTWRVVGPNKLRYSGYSASGILDELDIHHHHHHLHDHHDDEYDDDEEEEDHGSWVEQEKSETLVKTSSDNDDNDDDIIVHVGVTDDGDDGYMGYYDVGYVVNAMDDDDEGWSIVGGDQI